MSTWLLSYWVQRVERLLPKELRYSRNEEEKTAKELFDEKHKTMVQTGKEQLMEIGKTYSGLVAAVVFASSFSIPGEKDVNNNPIFLHKTAFKIFSHAYVVGWSCAATALVLFLSLLTSPYRVRDFRRSLPTKFLFANMSFLIAMVALLVAFTSNFYLNIYGGRKVAETKDIVPLVCELTIFPAVYVFFCVTLSGIYRRSWLLATCFALDHKTSCMYPSPSSNSIAFESQISYFSCFVDLSELAPRYTDT